MSQFEDLAVEGAAISAKPEQERFADIITPEPHYEELPSLDDPEVKNKKLIISVKISGKDIAEYYPNKTSARFIANRIGTDMTQWAGNRIFWGVVKQKVAGNDKQVLYVEKVEPTPDEHLNKESKKENVIQK